ncbi:MAG: hypothetical protein GY694_01935 [Gammaproteobacteria bacterium]|nr:hypothetical protein [Gammaproteobacteria bacterium]
MNTKIEDIKYYKFGNFKKILLAFAMAVTIPSLSLAAAPLAYEASPDIYKVIAEDENMRVIEATFQPGQKDNWHSHPAMVSYRLTDCKARIHKGNGGTKDIDKKTGLGSLRNKQIKKHSFENTGTNICKIFIVELKK